MVDYLYIHPEYEKILRSHDLLNLRRLLAWREGLRVSRHEARECRRIEIATDSGVSHIFYLRQEHRIPLAEIGNDLVRSHWPTSRAVKLLRAGELFSAAGIGVAPVAAVIEKRHFGLPSRAAAIQSPAAGKDLYSLLLGFGRPNCRMNNPCSRQRLLAELGALLARIQFAKIDWPDLAAKHIFAEQINFNDRNLPWWQFTLIDIERARAGLTAKVRETQFEQFLYTLRGLISRTDLIRIALGYIGLNQRHPKAVRRNLWTKFFPNGAVWLGKIRAEMEVLRDFPSDQPLPEEDFFERIGRLYVNVRFTEVLREQGLLEPDAIFKFQKGSELHKAGLGRRFRMRFDAILNGNWIWLYLKRVRHPRIKDQIDRILCGTVRHSSCRHERTMIKQLGQCRIPAPTVVAYAEKMFFGYEIASALITQGIVGQSLEKYIPKHFARAAVNGELTRRRNLIRQLANFVCRFHRSGFCHRDLYLSHIFIGFKESGNPIFYLIDLARCFKPRWRKQRWIIKDLGALNFSAPTEMISRTDRLRFFQTYMGVKKLDRRGRILLGRIVVKTCRIEAHAKKRRVVTEERALP